MRRAQNTSAEEDDASRLLVPGAHVEFVDNKRLLVHYPACTATGTPTKIEAPIHPVDAAHTSKKGRLKKLAGAWTVEMGDNSEVDIKPAACRMVLGTVDQANAVRFKVGTQTFKTPRGIVHAAHAVRYGYHTSHVLVYTDEDATYLVKVNGEHKMEVIEALCRTPGSCGRAEAVQMSKQLVVDPGNNLLEVSRGSAV